MIWVTESTLMERSWSRPEMVLIASSSGSATFRSMLSGSAPGWITVTTTTGKSTLGIESTPIRG